MTETDKEFIRHCKEATRHLTEVTNHIHEEDEELTKLEATSLTLMLVAMKALEREIYNQDNDSGSDFKYDDDHTFT